MRSSGLTSIRLPECAANGGLHPVTVGPSESRTYRAMPIAATKRSTCKSTQQQSCLRNSDFDGSMPGLQVPNVEGIAVSKAVEICSYNMSKNIEPAVYCLFVRGVNADAMSFEVGEFAY
jgi:hypothetical protein